MTDHEISNELKNLRVRKARLLRLVSLRHEVTLLEMEKMNGYNFKPLLTIIIDEVCKTFDLSFDMLIANRRRTENIAKPRQVAFYLARELSDLTLESIGTAFGRDHGTILHACRAIRDRMDTDQAFKQKVTVLTEACRSRINLSNDLQLAGSDQGQPGNSTAGCLAETLPTAV